MKKILEYYLFIERLVQIAFFAPLIIIIMVASVIFSALIINGLYEIGSSVNEYLTLHNGQMEYCRTLAKNNSNIYWKDETILGFGQEGSYGCFMKDPEVEK